jgi:hypothetical protein
MYKSNLVIFKILPFCKYMLAPAVLPLLNAPDVCWEESEVARTEIWTMWWLVLCRNVLHLEGDATGCTGTVRGALTFCLLKLASQVAHRPFLLLRPSRFKRTPFHFSTTGTF